MADAKPQFAALPNRAIWDRRLTDRDVRNLAAYAAHDRLSHSSGKGQGAWASQRRLAAMAGTEYSRFSVSTNRLLGFGYLVREHLATDRRKYTYRVIYTAADSLPSSKELAAGAVCREATDSGETVCSDPDLSAFEIGEIHAQYISQSEEINSAEAGKRNSSEEARFTARDARQDVYCTNVGAELGKLERALKANAIDADDLGLWLPWLEGVSEADYGDPINGWANRLIEACGERLELMHWEGATAAGQSA